jgi:protein O-GlcNAc transferase
MNNRRITRRCWIAALICLSLAGCTQHRLAERFYVQGQLAAEQGQTDKAIADLTAAINYNPDMVLAYEERGDLYQDRGRLHDALADYSKASYLNPNSFHSWYELGVVNQELQQFEDAITAYQRALELQPESSIVAMNLAITYAQEGKPDFGIIYGRRAIENAQNSFDAWTNLGVIYSLLAAKNADYRAQAIKCFKESLELQPRQPAVYLNLAQVYLDGDDFEQAQAVLQTAQRLAPSPLVSERLGYCLYRLGQFDEVTDAYHDSLKMDPDYVAALNGLGVVDMSQVLNGAAHSDELRQGALAQWKKSLNINPDQPLIQKLVQRFDAGSN